MEAGRREQQSQESVSHSGGVNFDSLNYGCRPFPRAQDVVFTVGYWVDGYHRSPVRGAGGLGGVELRSQK